MGQDSSYFLKKEQQMKAIQSLKAALAAATPDWSVVQAGVEGNFGGEHIEIHDGYGRTATVYGDQDDPETIANANLMALAQNHMADLLDAVEALAILREAYLNNDPKLQETLQGVLAGDVVSCLMERLASGRKAPEVECVEVAQQGRVQVFQGYFGYEGTQLNVEFQAPVGATVAAKDAAFVAALAQQADIDYHAVGESDQPSVQDLGVFKYLDVSTGHISKSSMEFLESVAGTNEIGQTVSSYEYGCFVSVREDREYHKSVPADLRKVLNFAQDKGCFIVRFDADGEGFEELPTFNW